MSRMVGFHVTEETKNKLRKINAGSGNPFHGKRHSQETKITIGEKSEKWHAEHSDFRRGANNPNFGRRGPDSPSFGLKRSDETRKKQSLLKLGRYSGPGHPMWGKRATAEHRKNLSLAHLGKKNTPEAEARRMASLRTPEHRAKQSAIAKAQWQDPAYREKALCGTLIRPSSAEKMFEEIASGLIEYVGDGKLWVTLPNGKHKNPDFRIGKTRKIIEVHGDYWHRNQNPQELIDLYKKIGFDCLVIWERELYGAPVNVRQKVEEFAALRAE